MVPRPPFSKLVLCNIKIMMDERSVDIISGNFSWHFLVLECYFFRSRLSFTWSPSRLFPLLGCCFRKYLIDSHCKMRHSKRRSNVKSFWRKDVSFWTSTFLWEIVYRFKILLKFALELKRTDIGLFKSTNAPQSALHLDQKTWHEFHWFSDRSYFMKNEQCSDEIERKSATAATVCLHLNSRSFFLSLFLWLFIFLSQNVIIPNNSKK